MKSLLIFLEHQKGCHLNLQHEFCHLGFQMD